MFHLRACRAMGWVTGVRYGVDLVEIDLADGRTLLYTWARFGALYRW